MNKRTKEQANDIFFGCLKKIDLRDHKDCNEKKSIHSVVSFKQRWWSRIQRLILADGVAKLLSLFQTKGGKMEKGMAAGLL